MVPEQALHCVEQVFMSKRRPPLHAADAASLRGAADAHVMHACKIPPSPLFQRGVMPAFRFPLWQRGARGDFFHPVGEVRS
jgi:hypothetical protein